MVQLYLRDVVSSVTRPVKELKGFQRVTLKPGETKAVSFTLGHDALGFWKTAKEFVVEPGKFDVTVGGSSAAGLTDVVRAEGAGRQEGGGRPRRRPPSSAQPNTGRKLDGKSRRKPLGDDLPVFDFIDAQLVQRQPAVTF